ncbi:uncharacterized protein LOC121403142 [Xenopus laevis]|uniref:Uncharacterized protein LOC121403142 n=1 Tax=Xenopus laevis TaxID=8355 RepID=A0A8J1MZQ3_XENLA|nr:uncharacterized protein LOC121403142 [Xenopus laevis]
MPDDVTVSGNLENNTLYHSTKRQQESNMWSFKVFMFVLFIIQFNNVHLFKTSNDFKNSVTENQTSQPQSEFAFSVTEEPEYESLDEMIQAVKAKIQPSHQTTSPSVATTTAHESAAESEEYSYGGLDIMTITIFIVLSVAAVILIMWLIIKNCCMKKKEHDVERQMDDMASVFSMIGGTIIIISEISNEPRKTTIITYGGQNTAPNKDEGTTP